MQYDPKAVMKAISWDNETETTKANNWTKKGSSTMVAMFSNSKKMKTKNFLQYE